ncbi:uncharacterized protein TOT_010000987 [Theileria orientalis strain Shintoku]|uniref:Uncharacterized protein n=1 Tax=Theileria orientalis strain Shintoku TaxID=869250 RepID=J4CCK1_THEOR|nr:uncharacterized protein TOT_010000987 [Theileria orientalis strain Shintoku]BAM39532.1 uncharacterized protein TOT_010000987 [Theileria orientalis strain Shintoku]|eukprot:XP_009689833.1 uncharacterized protein TOT_010000987 [Theileria orientalis strain Shintoku]
MSEIYAWVRLKGLFLEQELEKNKTYKPKSYKIKSKIYPITLRQYFGDLHCKRTYSGSLLRCKNNKTNCKCIKKALSGTGVSTACLYGDELTDCRGASFENREYTLESIEIFNDNNICRADDSWKYEERTITEAKNINLNDSNIDPYIDKKVRLGDTRVTNILNTFNVNPVRYIHSDLYYYNKTTKRNINDTPAQNFTDEKCWYFKTFEKRHGVDISSSQCVGELESCNLKDEYKLCKFVKTRYYRYKNEAFEMNFEDFNLSNVYSVYLEEEGRKCGQAANEHPEIEKVKFLQVTILKEITLTPRRVFHLGPFGPYTETKKLKICACSSYTKTNKIYSCVRKSDYDIEIGEVVIRGKKTVSFQDSDSGKPINVSVQDQIAFMVESWVIDEDCTKLFDLYKVDWNDYTVEDLPSLSKYFVMGENSEDNRTVTFRGDVAGKFCVCLVGKNDAMIETSEQGYRVKGVKNNIDAIAYKDSKGKRIVDGILVETVGIEAEYIESIFVVDSKKSCDGESVGEWSGRKYRYNTLSASHEQKYLIYDEFRFLKEDAVLDENLICVKYTNLEGKYAVGLLSEREYKDYRIHTLNKPVDIDQVQPDDMYIFYATNNLEKFESWREQFKRLNERRRVGSHQVGDLNSNEGFVDKYFKKMVHFEVYKGKNRISMSVANEEETLLLPIYDVTIDSPSKMRMVVTSKKVYWYVLMDSKRLLVRYDVDNIVERYELRRDVVFNDIILYHPMDFEVLQQEDLVKIVLIDSSSSCIVMLDSELRHIKSICNNIENTALVNPLSITCSASQKGSKIFNCFVVENTTDMIIWLSVDIGKEELSYVSNYLTGTVADDLDPHLGSISSVESYVYNDSKIDTTLLFIIRENPEFWAILLPDVATKKIHFVTTLSNLPGYSRVKRICPTYNGPTEHKLMIIREHYINYPLKKGNDIQDIFERVRDEDNIKWVLTWAPLESILQIPDFSYNIPENIVYKDSLRLAPQFMEYERFKKMITYHIGNYEDLNGYVKNTFAIDRLTGELSITVNEIKVRRLKLTIVASILAVEDKIDLDINFSCRDGEYYDGSSCLQCPVGYYYSVSMNPRDGSDWPKCTKCPENKITRREGSSSLEDCTCDKGSTVVIDPVTSLEICEPCPPGTYKSTVGSEPCIGSCYKNSETKVIGSKSEEERRCECLPGYYWGGHDQGINECVECEKGYFCLGGFKSNRNKCPENMTSQPGSNDQDKCVCMMGCEPVLEGSQVSLIQKEQGFRSQSDTLKCKPCPKNKYKDTESNDSCTECPINSYTGENGSQKKSDCSKCNPGYYETGLEDEPCRKCRENMYCVGSNAKERVNKKYEGKMERCPENSKSTYFDVITQHCTICPIGKYCMGGKDDQMNHRQPMDCADSNALTKTTGASSISECACKPGYYMDKDSNNICKECPENHYKSYVSNDLCTKCDENSSTSGKKGSTSKEQCVCDPGYYFDNGCVSCNFNDRYCPGGVIEIKDNKGAIKIVTQTPIKCPPNTEITPGVDNASSIKFCKCKKGYSFVSEDDVMNTKKCAPCSPGTYKSSVMDSSCNGLCTQNATSLNGAVSSNQCFCRSGYYYLEGGVCSNNSNTPGSCLGNDKCSSSMEHYLCSECKMGYTNNFVKGVLCQQCPNMFINISLTMIYGLGLLLINIVMACLNISAGFNRRSIHSVVIKIALNYAICTSVINVINFAELKIPMGLSRITNSFTKVFDSEDVVYYTSIDCLIRKFLKVNHADSLFYVTLKYNDTRTKLALLQQAEIQGMHKISEKLREQYENERLLMIFRYIPLPNQTIWLKFRNFIEDMIPIYVTVLFSVHGKITSRMLSLLDCSYIDLGRSFPGKYMLRPAMSIKCSLYPSDGYIKYLILGLSGLVIWGFGIPFLSFTVLYTNRKNLYATSIRMKYGFLHNGFRQDYWYWETIVFTRKCLVLVIGSIVIVPSQNYSGSRIWMALVVAIIFLIVQLIYKPFDERDYFVLGRLENHSMIAWTFTLILFSIIIESNFSPIVNFFLFTVIVILNVLFVLEVLFFFIISFYSNAIFLINEHFSKANFTYIKASHILYSNQPFVSYDQTNEVITLKPKTKRLRLTKSDKNLTYDHLNYLVNSISNLYTIAVHEIKLDVIPSMLIEFLIRYSISMANVENKILEKCLFNEFSGGNLSKLIVHVTTDNYNNLNKFINLKKYKKDNPSDHYINAIVNSLFDDDILINDLFLSDLFRSIEKLANLDKKALSLLYALFKHFKFYFERKESQEMEEKLNNLNKIKSELQMRRIDGSHGEELKRSVDKLMDEVNVLKVKKVEYIEQLKELDAMEFKFKKEHDNILLNVNKEGAMNDNSESRFGDMIQDLGFESHERSEFITEVNPDDFE